MGHANKITNLEELKAWMRTFMSPVAIKEWCSYWSRESKLMSYQEATDETFWILREYLRLEYSHYKSCCFVSAHMYPTHFLHISQDNPELIAYTPDEKYGRADRQIRMKLGRYLTRFFPDLSEDEIKYWVDRHRLDMGLVNYKIAKTAEEIERVYRTGPGSCMSKSLDEYKSHVHPSHVYAGPDTAVAYIEMDNGDITARTVIVPEKKVYVRIYGHAVLGELLKKDGYKHGSLKGCRLDRIEVPNRNAVVMPYLDDQIGSAHYVIDEGDYMRVDDLHGIDAQGTDGILHLDSRREDEHECCHCSEVWHEDDITWVYGDSPVCPNCLADRYVEAYDGRRTIRWYERNDEDIHYVESTGCYYTSYALEVHGFAWSDHYEDYVNVNECVEDNNGELILREDAIRIFDTLCGSYIYQHVDDYDKEELFIDPTKSLEERYSINEPEDTVMISVSELAEHMAERNPDLLRGNKWNYTSITALLTARFGGNWEVYEPLVSAIARELHNRMTAAELRITVISTTPADDYSLAA